MKNNLYFNSIFNIVIFFFQFVDYIFVILIDEIFVLLYGDYFYFDIDIKGKIFLEL